MSCPNALAAQPYPNSTHITSFSPDTTQVSNYASGSDLFPFTWDSNEDMFTTWGDGPGFQGSAKASWGLARVGGTPPDSLTGDDRYECAVGSGDCTGKCNGGIIALGTTLYVYKQEQSLKQA